MVSIVPSLDPITNTNKRLWSKSHPLQLNPSFQAVRAMHLQVSSVQPSSSLQILLEQQPDGQIRASIPALLNCSVSRLTREAAIAAIQQLLSERLSTLEILAVDLTLLKMSRNPG
ncbi:hypothetical protein ACKFKF_29040 [Phormidesmis sp. 146-12]